MSRNVTWGFIVAVLVGLGWVAGRAQSASPDFEIIVSAPSGATEITCVRGCSITWAPPPTNGAVEMLVPGAKLQGAASSPKGCVAATWSPQNCRIWGFIKR